MLAKKKRAQGTVQCEEERIDQGTARNTHTHTHLGIHTCPDLDRKKAPSPAQREAPERTRTEQPGLMGDPTAGCPYHADTPTQTLRVFHMHTHIARQPQLSGVAHSDGSSTRPWQSGRGNPHLFMAIHSTDIGFGGLPLVAQPLPWPPSLLALAS